MKVEIMSREELEARSRAPFLPRTAVISITDAGDEDVELTHQPDRILRLKFDDVGYEIYEDVLGRKPSAQEKHQIDQKYAVFSDAQSRQLAKFVLQARDEGRRLICQCEFGQSRSAAVAAAVVEHLEGKGIRIFADERYYPNKLIFAKLLRSLHTYDSQMREKE